MQAAFMKAAFMQAPAFMQAAFDSPMPPVIAPGDFASTHKVTEAMAIGGRGGCIP